MMATPVPAQPPQPSVPSGMSVQCQSGVSFDNGVEVTVIQMRSGYTYTATAIGLNGFDPVLAVLNDSGEGLCTDDDQTAAAYSASLPTTGYIAPQSTNAQIHFANNSGNPFEDVSLIVGGFGNQSGEFLLILEGMAVTEGDSAGDPFSIQITPGMVASGVPLTTYMISVTDQMDPLMAAVDSNYDFLTDSNGQYIACDDAGDSSLCWGQSASLAGSYVSRTQGRQLGGYGLDGMLMFDLDSSMTESYFNLLMRSSGQETVGDYLIAFHVGIGEVLLPGESA
jgi:hypothetical protein